MDGRFLYYSKYETPGIWKMAIDGGEETRIVDQPQGNFWYNWVIAENGIYYLAEDLMFYDFATGKKTTVFIDQKPLLMGLTVSPDGKSIIYPQVDVIESNIMLVKNSVMRSGWPGTVLTAAERQGLFSC